MHVIELVGWELLFSYNNNDISRDKLYDYFFRGSEEKLNVKSGDAILIGRLIDAPRNDESGYVVVPNVTSFTPVGDGKFYITTDTGGKYVISLVSMRRSAVILHPLSDVALGHVTFRNPEDAYKE